MQPDFQHTTRALAADTGPARALLGLIGALLLGWGLWMGLGRVTLTESSEVATVQARGVARLRAPATALVTEVSAALGDRVEAGQVLVALDDAEQVLALSAARAEVAGLRAQLDRLDETATVEAEGDAAADQARRAELRQARAALTEAQLRTDEAEAAVARLTGLAASGAVGSAELDAARTEAQARRARQNSAEAELSRLAGRRSQDAASGHARQTRSGEDRARLQTQLAGAEAEVARQERALALRRLIAPLDGTLGELAPLVPGQMVEQSSLLAVVVPYTELMVLARFPPDQAVGRLQPGQDATVRVRGAVGGLLGARPATVSRVGSEAGPDGRVPVELVFTGPTEGVTHGLPAEVEVAIESVAPFTVVMRASGQSGL